MSNLNLKPIIINNNFKMNTQKGMLDYLVRSENSLQSMIDRTNSGIMLALQNLRSATLVNEKLPQVNEKLYAELIDTITLDKKRPLNLIYDERLKKLTYTQEKIYKILAKIEEDLIDEQDTSIKDISRGGTQNINYTLLAQKIIEQENAQNTGSYGTGGTGSAGGTGSTSGTESSTGTTSLAGAFTTGALGTLGTLLTGKYLVNKFKGKPPVPSGGKASVPKGKVPFKKIFKFAGKAIAPIKLLVLIYDFVKYLDIANDTIEDSGCIERFIFATAGATSEFVHFEYELLNMIINGLDKLIMFIDTNLTSILDGDLKEFNELKSSNLVTVFFKSMVPMVMGTKIFSLFVHEVLKPVMDYCDKNSKWGIDAGYLAVEMYRSMKDRFMSEVPNGSTFELIFGTNKDLESSIESGMYTWHTWGTSDLVGDAESIAKLMTKSELDEIAKHNDLDDFSKEKLKKAMELKDSAEYSDIKTIELRKTKVNYQHILNALEKNDTDMGKVWYEFIFKCKEYAKVKPENCVIEGHYNNDKFESFTVPNVLAPSSAGDSSDKAKEFTSILLKHLKKLGFNIIKETDKDEFWFTIYGTIVQSYNVFDVIKYENLVREGMKKPHKGKLASRINKVIGFLDPETLRIKDKQVAPNDNVFEKVFDTNIITNTDIKTENKVLSSENFKYGYGNNIQERNNVSITPHIESVPVPTTQIPNISAKKVPINEVSRIVWNKLLSYGFTKEQTAGIMGNMMQESTMRPWIKNSIGAFGLCQWLGVRYKALVKFANGRDLNDPALQIEFLMHELNTTEKNAYNKLKQAKSIEEATWAWVKYFERPGKHEYFTEKRIGYARGFYNNNSSETIVEPQMTDVPQYGTGNSQIQTGGSQIQTGSSQFMYSNGSESLKYGNTGGISGGNNSTVIKASRYARSHAHAKSQGRCARYVANALQASGFKFNRQPSAYMYHTNGVLSKMGFRLVHSGLRGFVPQIGDVCVINRFGKHVHGHICIWDGRNWISDFVQRNASPYSAGAPGGAWFYRYGDGNVDISNSVMEETTTMGAVTEYTSDVGTISSSDYSNTGDKKRINANMNVSNDKSVEPIKEFGEAENLFFIKYDFCMV